MHTLSIVTPEFNEKSTVREIFQRVEAVSLLNIQKEIIFVDDFSTDSTRKILKKEIEGLNRVLVLYH